MADRLFDAGTADLGAPASPDIHTSSTWRRSASVNDRGTTVTLGESEAPPADRRHVNQSVRGTDAAQGRRPPGTNEKPLQTRSRSRPNSAADDAGGDRHRVHRRSADDGFVLRRNTGVTADQTADRNERTRRRVRSRSREERRGRTRAPAPHDRGGSRAHPRRRHPARRPRHPRKIVPVTPAGRGVWIEIDADGRTRVGFR